jgi:hypothetical protein
MNRIGRRTAYAMRVILVLVSPPFREVTIWAI